MDQWFSLSDGMGLAPVSLFSCLCLSFPSPELYSLSGFLKYLHQILLILHPFLMFCHDGFSLFASKPVKHCSLWSLSCFEDVKSNEYREMRNEDWNCSNACCHHRGTDFSQKQRRAVLFSYFLLPQKTDYRCSEWYIIPPLPIFF